MSVRKKMIVMLIAAVVAGRPDTVYTGDIHNEDGTLNERYVEYLESVGKTAEETGGEWNDGK